MKPHWRQSIRKPALSWAAAARSNPLPAAPDHAAVRPRRQAARVHGHGARRPRGLPRSGLNPPAARRAGPCRCPTSMASRSSTRARCASPARTSTVTPSMGPSSTWSARRGPSGSGPRGRRRRRRRAPGGATSARSPRARASTRRTGSRGASRTRGAPRTPSSTPRGSRSPGPCTTGQDKRAKFPTSKAPVSAVFHSFRLIFGRAIISRNGLEA